MCGRGSTSLNARLSPREHDVGGHISQRIAGIDLGAGTHGRGLSAKRYYQVKFTTDTACEVRYKDDPAAGYGAAAEAGDATQDSVFPAAKAYLLTHWWSGAHRAGDTFTFSADPASPLLE